MQYTRKQVSSIYQPSILFSLLLALFMSAKAQAQSTIFAIPSTDAASAGQGTARFDFISHLGKDVNGGFQTYLPRVTYGVGKGTEVGVNVGATTSIASTTAFIQPNVKWQFYKNEDAGIAFSGGSTLFVPVRDRANYNTFGLFYLNGSKKFRQSYGPRFTAGIYTLTGLSNAVAPNKTGAMVGYEQPIAKRVSFVTDWMSGKNGFGYVTPGFSIAATNRSNLKLGYSVGNYLNKNNGVFVSYGYSF